MNLDLQLDNIFGIKLSYKTQEKINKKPLWKYFLSFFQQGKKLNQRVELNDFNEMRSEIMEIRNFKKQNPDYPLIKKGSREEKFYESTRDQYMAEPVPEEYRKKFKPYYDYSKFSQKNKIRYLVLSFIIDNLFGIEKRKKPYQI